MSETNPDLDALQAAYKQAVETWIGAIREEEALASVAHDIAEIDQWEAAHFREDEIRAASEGREKGVRRRSAPRAFRFLILPATANGVDATRSERLADAGTAGVPPALYQRGTRAVPGTAQVAATQQIDV